MPLVEDGVARGVVWDRGDGARARDEQARRHRPRTAGPIAQYGPLPSALSVAPGEAESVDELAELVGDGIYVTRLHYLGIVDPREGVITGMTRDGTFRIRDGQVAEPLVNLRFTVAVPELLAEVPGLDAASAAREPERVLRRALPARRARAGARDRALHVTGTGSGSGPGL